LILDGIDFLVNGATSGPIKRKMAAHVPDETVPETATLRLTSN